MNCKEKKIIICDKCNGVGHFDKKIDIGSHKAEYKYYSETCDKCNGTGRLLKTTTESIKPYVVTKKKYGPWEED